MKNESSISNEIPLVSCGYTPLAGGYLLNVHANMLIALYIELTNLINNVRLLFLPNAVDLSMRKTIDILSLFRRSKKQGLLVTG